MIQSKTKMSQLVAIITIPIIVLFSVLSLNMYQQVHAGSGLDIIVNTVTDSDNTNLDIVPTIIVVRDNQTFGVKEASLITDDGITATSEAVFHFDKSSIENEQEFLACAIFSYDGGYIDSVCDEGSISLENSTEIIELDHALD